MDQSSARKVCNQSDGSPRSWLNEDKTVDPASVTAGNVVYLPKDDRAYDDVNRKPFPKARGHPVLIIETFIDDHQPHRAWVLLITSRVQEPTKHLHVGIVDEFPHKQLIPGGGRRIFMDRKNCHKWPQVSYLNAAQVFELPIHCLQYLSGTKDRPERKITQDSLILARRVASEAVGDALMRTELYDQRMAGHLRIKVEKGILCWAQPTATPTTLLNADKFCTGAGPCVVLSIDEEIATICFIFDNRDGIHHSSKQKHVARRNRACCLPISARSISKPHRSLEKKKVRAESHFVIAGHLQEQQLLISPTFEINVGDLHGLPQSYLMDRKKMKRDDLPWILKEVRKARERKEEEKKRNEERRQGLR